MPDDKKIPEGRFGRLQRLARLGARTGASLLLSKDGGGAAQQAAEVLGNLRGLAAKVGQMASYVDGLVPDAHRGSYETALSALRAAAPQSSSAAIRRVVEEELQGPLDRLFVEFEDQPLASASIGQVHRARLHDGRAVAVKVQHPGIGAAVESDLSNASMLEGMAAGLGARRYNSKGVLREIQERFRAELDYQMEAAWQERFRALHAGDPHIHIPQVIGDRTARRVLTTELVSGLAFEAACERPEAERARWCQTLWRFVFRGNIVGRMFNADPHPGNYFFQPEGRVTFLDFGCVLPLEDPSHGEGVELHRAALLKDEGRFRAAAARLLQTRGGRYEEMVVDYTRRCFAPILSSPYRVTRDYSAGLLDAMKEMAIETRKLDEFVPMPANILFLNRLQFGFYSVLARLDAEVDYAEVERAYVPGLPSAA